MERDRITRYILPSSIAMLGVALTAIGLVKVAEEHIGPSNVDKFCAITMVAFFASAILSYASLRVDPEGRAAGVLERTAEIFFGVGVLLLTAIIALFAYEVV